MKREQFVIGPEHGGDTSSLSFSIHPPIRDETLQAEVARAVDGQVETNEFNSVVTIPKVGFPPQNLYRRLAQQALIEAGHGAVLLESVAATPEQIRRVAELTQ